MDPELKKLCDTIRETGFAIHCYHKHGKPEKIYENALGHRLRKLGIDARQQHPLTVYDEDGTVLGDFKVDLLIENICILELKVAKAIIEDHERQLYGYLRSSKYEHGMILNFGAPKFQVRKYVVNEMESKVNQDGNELEF